MTEVKARPTRPSNNFLEQDLHQLRQDSSSAQFQSRVTCSVQDLIEADGIENMHIQSGSSVFKYVIIF